jgi:hypothetical protein
MEGFPWSTYSYALPPAHPEEFTGEAFGHVSITEEDKVATLGTIAAQQTGPVLFGDAAPELMDEQADDESPVFFWEAEQIVLGALLATWNQLQVGSCVGFGSTRNAQDLELAEIAGGIGDPERWAGAEGCPEITYAGSRVEIGGGRINGDGSNGTWAGAWFNRFGFTVRGVYGNLDLRTYNQTTCRQLGDRGVPPEIEALAKAHPVTQVALVTSATEGWAAIGGFKPIPVCSNQGFAMQRNPDGTCTPRGTWAHCMATRGRAMITRTRGNKASARRCVIIGNSWGNYLGDGNNVIEYIAKDGSLKTIVLPPGHFAVEVDVWDSMLRQRDSMAYAGLSGWQAVKLSHNPLQQ